MTEKIEFFLHDIFMELMASSDHLEALGDTVRAIREACVEDAERMSEDAAPKTAQAGDEEAQQEEERLREEERAREEERLREEERAREEESALQEEQQKKRIRANELKEQEERDALKRRLIHRQEVRDTLRYYMQMYQVMELPGATTILRVGLVEPLEALIRRFREDHPEEGTGELDKEEKIEMKRELRQIRERIGCLADGGEIGRETSKSRRIEERKQKLNAKKELSGRKKEELSGRKKESPAEPAKSGNEPSESDRVLTKKAPERKKIRIL